MFFYAVGMRHESSTDSITKFAGFGKKKGMVKQIQMFDDRLTEQGETLLAVFACKRHKTAFCN